MDAGLIAYLCKIYSSFTNWCYNLTNVWTFHLEDYSLWNFKLWNDISFIWIILNVWVYSCATDELTYRFILVIVYTWSETWLHLVWCPPNVISWIKEPTIDSRCQITLFSYFTTVWLNISRIFHWNCRGKITKPRYTTQHPLETKMADHVMLNPRKC